MEYLNFIFNMVSSLAWPITVMFGLYLFKDPISTAITLISKLKYKDLDVEFNKIEAPRSNSDADRIGNDNCINYMLVPMSSLFEVAKVSPKVAVLEAGRSLKYEFDRSIDRFVGSSKPPSQCLGNGQEEISPLQISPALIELGHLLKIREDLAENSQYEVTEENAVKYIIAANKYCGLFKNIYQE